MAEAGTSRSHHERRRVWLLLMAGIVAFSAFALIISAAGEPYHIDELRQVRSYDRPIEAVVEASFAQEQPPLDPVLNSLVQGVIGVGDVKQRALSVLFGLGALVLAGALAKQAGMSRGGQVAVMAVVASTSALVAVTAYARPYALPLFLMLLMAWAVTGWITDGRLWQLGVVAIAAVLLPLSRTAEPVIMLGVLGLVALVSVLVGRDERRKRWLAVIAVGAVAVVTVAIPVLLRLRDDVDDFTGSPSLGDAFERAFTEIAPLFGSVFGAWLLILALALVALAVPTSRALISNHLGFWLITATALGFVISFVLLTPTSQTFYERYTFSWVVPVAMIVGFGVTAVGQLPSSVAKMTAGLAALIIVFIGGFSLLIDSTRASRGDWRATSDLLVRDLPEDTGFLFDPVTGLGSYRTPYAGFPRYTGSDRPVPMTLQVIRDAGRAVPGSNSAIVLLAEERYDVDGFVSIGVDNFFTVYLPETPYPDLDGLAAAAEQFGWSMPVERGAALLLAAASLWLEADDSQRAESIVLALLGEPAIAGEVAELIRGTELAGFGSA